MNTAKKTLIAITITGILSGSSLAVLADTAKDQPFEGLVVEDVIVIEQLPTEVQTGSLNVKNNDESNMASKAKITSSEAARIATTARPGTVVKTKLDDENGYLVWEVEMIGPKGKETKLMIDAGNGRLLAAERDNEDEDEDKNENEKKSGKGWKFWEDSDKDEHQDRD